MPRETVLANDRELSASELQRHQQRQRNRIYRLGYVIVRPSRPRLRVVAFHRIGGDGEAATS